MRSASPVVRSVLWTRSLTPERMRRVPLRCEVATRIPRLRTAVESMKGTERIRRIRTGGAACVTDVTSSKRLAMPKKKGPSIS